MYYDISAVDLSYGALFCNACGDYMYDAEFEEISRSQFRQADKKYGMFDLMYTMFII